MSDIIKRANELKVLRDKLESRNIDLERREEGRKKGKKEEKKERERKKGKTRKGEVRLNQEEQ